MMTRLFAIVWTAAIVPALIVSVLSAGGSTSHAVEPSGVRAGSLIVPEAPTRLASLPLPDQPARTVSVPRGEPRTATTAPDYELAIHQAALEFNADAAFLLRVARCESRMDPNAIGDHGMSLGLFQFQAATFLGYARLSGLGYSLADLGDPHAQIRLAAWAFANGRSSAWSCAR